MKTMICSLHTQFQSVLFRHHTTKTLHIVSQPYKELFYRNVFRYHLCVEFSANCLWVPVLLTLPVWMNCICIPSKLRKLVRQMFLLSHFAFPLESLSLLCFVSTTTTFLALTITNISGCSFDCRHLLFLCGVSHVNVCFSGCSGSPYRPKTYHSTCIHIFTKS